jgi:general secretion pathway protein G
MNKNLLTNKSLSSRFASQRGLTLVEIIVVLVILAILITFLGKGLFGQGEKAKASITGLKIERLKGYINEYQLRYNKFPSSLKSLTTCDDNTGGGCIEITKEEDDLLDAWGTPFQYSSDGSKYAIKSLGSDRREGGSGAEGDVIREGP